MQLVTKTVNYLKESVTELKKVVWPTKEETKNHTLLVIGISAGMAIFLGVIADFLLSLGVEKLIQ